MARPGSRAYLKVHPLENLSELMRLLQNPCYIKIARCLARSEMNVSAIIKALDLKQSAVSHPLAKLREHGFVEVTRNKKHRIYRLSPAFKLTIDADQLELSITCFSGEVLRLRTPLVEPEDNEFIMARRNGERLPASA